MGSLTKELIENASTISFLENTLNFVHRIFTAETRSRGAMGGCKSPNMSTIKISNGQRRALFISEKKSFHLVHIFSPGTLSLFFNNLYLLSYEINHSRQRESQQKLYDSRSVSKNKKG